MEVRDIRYFKVVAEYRNIGRAADALDLSATALSKSLRRLERGLGAKLVKRTARGVELTAVGSALASRANTLQLTLDDLEREAADLTRGVMGDVRVGAPPGSCEYCVADAYSALLKETTSVRLRTVVVDRDQLWAAFNAGQVDFIVNSMRPVPLKHPGVECEEIMRDQWVVYASANHPLARCKQVTFAELENERWAMDTSSFTWDLLCSEFQGRGLARPTRILESNSVAMRLPVIASSNLLSMSASMTLSRAQRQYALVKLLVQGLDVVRGTGIFYRKNGYLSPAAHRLIAILKEQGRAITASQRNSK